MKKKIITLTLALLMLFVPFISSRTINQVNASEKIVDSSCKAYVLMDKNSGKVLNENNGNARMPVASIVKLMTILLTLEKIDSGEISITDTVMVSENASGMGGSQIFLDANCEYELGNLLKSVIVCSANDSSIAIAEYIAGSEQLFVKEMNEKAKKLNMTNTNYENATGLPSTNQYSSALDVAKVLREVLNYDLYQEYSKVWLEEFVHPSGRTTEMTNTNKLSRFYEGCLGGKTGSTNEAKYCLGVGAKRNNLSLIAVALGCESSKERFSTCSEMLNYGFNHYENKVVFSQENLNGVTIKMHGQNEVLSLLCERESNIVIEKGIELKVDLKYNLPTSLVSVKQNEAVGSVDIIINGEKYDSINLLSSKTIDEPSYLDYLKRIQEDFIG